ncbi:unnamed protein product [Lymnaea stagnalis]|uniref:Uncharacterized protein n=1 Tax=Lymnaea stagnalis TaxID=6523 RepID=A0AAV2HTJ0_LYMST
MRKLSSLENTSVPTIDGYMMRSVETYNMSRSKRPLVAVGLSLLLFILALVAVIVMAVILSQSDTVEGKTATGPNEQKDTQTYKCNSPVCISLAAEMSANLDLTTNPCDDFYQFACGGWLNKNVLFREQPQRSVTNVLQDRAIIDLKKLLEADVKPTDRDYIKKAKDYYASCVSHGSDVRGYSPLVGMINKEFGGWSLVTNQWNESTFDAEKMVATASRLSIDTICTFSVVIDYRDRITRVLRVDQPKFVLGEREAALDEQKLKEYQELITKMSAVFDIVNENATKSQILDVVQFEKNLSMISAIMPYGTNNPFSISRMQERYLTSAFDWKKFFVSVTSAPEIGIKNITDDEIIFRGPNAYFLSLKTFLLGVSKRTFSNFIIWRVLLAYKNILDFTNRDPKRLRLVTMLPDNEMLCLESMAIYENMKWASNGIYVRHIIQPSDREPVLSLVSRIQAAFNESVDNLDWLDNASVQWVKEKNANMKTKVFYSEQTFNETALDNYYFNMTFSRQTYLENVVTLNKESFDNMVRLFRVPNNPDDSWSFLPIIVNAIYKEDMNSIEFPAAFFQAPFFSRHFPNYINFGGIGTVVGHELTHGFDPVGVNYNKDGSIGRIWNQSFTDNFKNRTQCLTEFYNKIYVKDVNKALNGTSTLNENIADNSGIRQSFRAYQDWQKSSGQQEATLPGLNYTQNQLFYINYAQTFCTLIERTELLQQISTSYWSPARVRVLGPLQNSGDFSETFNCPTDSPMAPKHTCTVW